jgi:LacI family transcriptional regulator
VPSHLERAKVTEGVGASNGASVGTPNGAARAGSIQKGAKSEFRRPTMNDVAQLAGVSIKTVSRVVNDVPSVDAGIAARVLQAVTDLGFRRNDMARKLRSGNSAATVGLIIEDLANPFYSTIAAAVEEVAAQHETLLITASSEEDIGRERRFLLDLCERRVDGLLVVPASVDHSYLKPEIQMGTPVVFIDRPPVGLPVDAVLIDNAGGARQGIEHLLHSGHERIGLLIDSLAIYTARKRLAGAEAALDNAGIPRAQSIVRHDLHTPEAAARAVAEMLADPRPPTAFFCANNRTTVGALTELHRQGSDAALVGFDDFELSHLMPRPLTIVAYDVAALGRVAAERVFRRIGGERMRPSTTVLPTHLVQSGIRS